MKKIISVLITLVVCLSFGCITTLAIDAPSGCIDATITPTDSSTVTSARAREKLAKIEEYKKQQALRIANRATTNAWTYLNGFTIYTQLEKGFCMPACAQSILKYLTGSSDNQYTIAGALDVSALSGGQFDELMPYLNGKQDVNFYVQRDNSVDLFDMKFELSGAITVFEAPPVLRVNTKNMGSNWLYNSEGHATCIKGVRDDSAVFQFADPLVKRMYTYGNPYYTKTAELVYTAISPAYCGYIY